MQFPEVTIPNKETEKQGRLNNENQIKCQINVFVQGWAFPVYLEGFLIFSWKLMDAESTV